MKNVKLDYTFFFLLVFSNLALSILFPKVQRLPFLPSSNLSLDILRGNDETIGFEDILNGKCHSAPFPGTPVTYKVAAADKTQHPHPHVVTAV